MLKKIFPMRKYFAISLSLWVVLGSAVSWGIFLFLRSATAIPKLAIIFGGVASLLLLGISVFAAIRLIIQKPLQDLVAQVCASETEISRSKDWVKALTEGFKQHEMKSETWRQKFLHAERQLNYAKQELKHKAVLEEKAALISSTHRRLKESYQELSILFNISQTLTTTIDPQELANKLADVILKNVRLSDLSILMLGEDVEELEIKVERSSEALGYQFDKSQDAKEMLARRVLRKGQTVYHSNLLNEPQFADLGMTEPVSCLCIPMIVKDQTLGVCCFSRHEADGFSRHDIPMLTIVVRQAAIALENARLYAKTKELSLVDELTRIYNRRHFQKILEMEFKRARRFRRSLSLLLMDVDHFKKFNDSYGHLEGDRILAELAELFHQSLREVDTVARYGGEEFSVILPNTSLEDAERVALKLRKLVENMHSNRMKYRDMQVTISIGVASLDDEESLEDFINHADIALYQAKDQGRNCVVVYPFDQLGLLRAVE